MRHFRDVMKRVGWSTYKAAELLDVGESTVRDWMRDRRAVPPPLQQWFEALDDWLAEHPPPRRGSD